MKVTCPSPGTIYPFKSKWYSLQIMQYFLFDMWYFILFYVFFGRFVWHTLNNLYLCVLILFHFSPHLCIFLDLSSFPKHIEDILAHVCWLFGWKCLVYAKLGLRLSFLVTFYSSMSFSLIVSPYVTLIPIISGRSARQVRHTKCRMYY